MGVCVCVCVCAGTCIQCEYMSARVCIHVCIVCLCVRTQVMRMCAHTSCVHTYMLSYMRVSASMSTYALHWGCLALWTPSFILVYIHRACVFCTYTMCEHKHTCMCVCVCLYDCRHYIEVVLPCEHRTSLLCTASDSVHREQAAVPHQSAAPGLLWQSLRHRRHPRPHHQRPQDQGNVPPLQTHALCMSGICVCNHTAAGCMSNICVHNPPSECVRLREWQEWHRLSENGVLDCVNDKSGIDSVKTVC